LTGASPLMCGFGLSCMYEIPELQSHLFFTKNKNLAGCGPEQTRLRCQVVCKTCGM